MAWGLLGGRACKSVGVAQEVRDHSYFRTSISARNWIACAVRFISCSRDNYRHLDELWYRGTAMLVPTTVPVLSPCGSTSDRRSSERFT